MHILGEPFINNAKMKLNLKHPKLLPIAGISLAFLLVAGNALASMTFGTDTITSSGVLNFNPTGSPVTVNGDLTVTGNISSPGTSGQLLYNNAGNIGGFGSWDGTTLAIGSNSVPQNADFYHLISIDSSDSSVIGNFGVSDGYGYGDYTVGFVARNGDIDPYSGNPAVSGNVYSIGGMYGEEYDTTNPDSGILALYIRRGLGNGYPLITNGANDVAIGNANYDNTIPGMATVTGTLVAYGDGHVTIGPDESTLDPWIQEYAGAQQVLIVSKNSDSYTNGVVAEVENNAPGAYVSGTWGVAMGTYAYGTSGVAFTTSSGGQAFGVDAYASARGAINASDLFVINGEAPSVSGGATVTNAYGLYLGNVNVATNNYAIKTGLGKVEFGDVLQLDAVTFASLPACAAGLEGSLRSVNNSTTNVWGATITGGGANHVLAYCDGTNWSVMAK